MARWAVLALAAILNLGATAPVRLTPDCWGDLRIGMREAEVARRFHVTIPPDDEVNGPECRQFDFPPGGEAMSVLTEDGRVARISLYGKSAVVTDRGLGVGATEAQVRRAYGKTLRVEAHAYEERPARYLTAWAKGGRRGVRYQTDRKGVVTAIHAGDRSIRLIEGCL